MFQLCSVFLNFCSPFEMIWATHALPDIWPVSSCSQSTHVLRMRLDTSSHIPSMPFDHRCGCQCVYLCLCFVTHFHVNTVSPNCRIWAVGQTVPAIVWPFAFYRDADSHCKVTGWLLDWQTHRLHDQPIPVALPVKSHPRVLYARKDDVAFTHNVVWIVCASPWPVAPTMQ